MIDKTVKWLGQMPKRKRESILAIINILSCLYLVAVIVYDVKTPKAIDVFILFLCFMNSAIRVRVFQLGGWWWANDKD